jgi:hypothetical protein
MLCGVKMFRGVFVLRRIAATNMATAQTKAKVNPTVTHLQAFFATLGLRLHALNLIQVGTVFRHVGLLKNQKAA